MPTESSPSSATPLRRAIKTLPPLLVNQIAAGEVVERPASVVKEAVENALDAHPVQITVELEQGGIELIRITDDGSGIPEAELPLALAPHATSKVAAPEDLERIGTMGFRGEALASITSVSRLALRSRTAAQASAAVIEAAGDEIKPIAPAAGPVGTSLTVRNLFFNTPARRKFLRTPGTEQGRCADVVRDLAMANPRIAFRLVADGRTLLDVPRDQTAKERALAVMGKELESELIEVSADENDVGSRRPGPNGAPAERTPIALWGLIGLPTLARATQQAQHVYLNGRPIRDKTILHAIREAYRGLIEPGRFPTALIMLEMDPAAVDVNVHPAETEVRFRDQSSIHSIVYAAIRRALQSADLTPGVRGDTLGAGGGLGTLGTLNGGTGRFAGPQEILPRQQPNGASAQQFADYFKRPAPAPNQSFSFDAMRAAMQRAELVGATLPASQIEATAAAAAPGDPALMPAPEPAKRALQVHNSFLVTQDEQGMVIIDQHALHERVMFEKLLVRIGAGNLESQALLVPVVVAATERQLEILADLAPLLARIGVQAAPLGPQSIGIHAFPSFLFDRNVEAGEFMAELLDRAASSVLPPGEEEALHEVLDMMACKAAIKAGDALSAGELAEMLVFREEIERSSNCPHGRPTSIRVTIKELEKRFGRT